jgi:hypothetical protein
MVASEGIDRLFEETELGFKRVGLTLLGLRARAGWQGRLFSDPIGDRPGHPGPGHHGPGSHAC